MFYIFSIVLGYILAGLVKVNSDFNEQTVNPMIYTLSPSATKTIFMIFSWPFHTEGKVMGIGLWTISTVLIAVPMWLLDWWLNNVFYAALIMFGFLFVNILVIKDIGIKRKNDRGAM